MGCHRACEAGGAGASGACGPASAIFICSSYTMLYCVIFYSVMLCTLVEFFILILYLYSILIFTTFSLYPIYKSTLHYYDM